MQINDTDVISATTMDVNTDHKVGGDFTRQLVLDIRCPPGADSIEILLTASELRQALSLLED